jgi:hypothetical protein
MRNRLSSLSVVAFVAAGAIGVAAQAGAPAGAQNPQRPSDAQSQPAPTPRANNNKVTITGCVERASEGTTGTTGVAGTSATAGTKFMLTKATRSAAGEPAAAAAAGAAKAETGASYRLDDAAESKVSPHVGHKVEITGMVDNQGRAAGAASNSGGAATAAPELLKVDAVKMIAATCTGD